MTKFNMMYVSFHFEVFKERNDMRLSNLLVSCRLSSQHLDLLGSLYKKPRTYIEGILH